MLPGQAVSGQSRLVKATRGGTALESVMSLTTFRPASSGAGSEGVARGQGGGTAAGWVFVDSGRGFGDSVGVEDRGA